MRNRRVVAGFAAALILVTVTGVLPEIRATSADPGVTRALESPAAPQPPQPPTANHWQLPSPAKNAKLSTHLDQLFRIDRLARQTGRRIDASSVASLPDELRAAVEQRVVFLDGDGRVQVFADVTGDVHATAGALRAAGMDVERVSDEHGIVQGMIPVSQLEAAAALAGVRMVRPPDRPVRNAGSVLTEGDATLDANDLRAIYGVTGAGVRVGVISDGLEGVAAAQASGDMPAVVNTTTCDVIESAPPGQPANPTSAGAGAEGTAMLEIIHDLAPGAELWFGYYGALTSTATLLDFMDAVDCLAANTDIVVDDNAGLGVGPYDGTSSMSENASTELNRATNRIRGYYNAVGNYAQQHYQEPYVDSQPADASANLHLFQATANTTDAYAIGAADFDPVFLGSGGTVVVVLTWNDPFAASSNDYDLYLGRDSDLTIVAASTLLQNGSQDPVEIVVYTNPGASGFFDILIDKRAGAARTLDMFIPVCDCALLPNNAALNYNTLSSSVPNNSDAGGGVVSLGAINASDPGADTIAAYSSRGPTNDGRTKPDATALDAVAVTGSGGFGSPFFGTSASAPHAGAIAALVLNCKTSLKHGEPGDNPASDRTSLRTALLNSAADLGVAGVDNVYGSGRLDADAAAAAAGCLPDGDGDAVPDATDNCPADVNPSQLNSDAGPWNNGPTLAGDDVTVPRSDGLGDACDTDDDNDGLSDAEESTGAQCGSIVTNPINADTDGDHLLDKWECSPVQPEHAPNPATPLTPSDPTNAASKTLGTANRTVPGSDPPVSAPVDNDADRIPDLWELRGYNTLASSTDSDGDGCHDLVEVASVDQTRGLADPDRLAVARRVLGVWAPEPNQDRVFDVDHNGSLADADRIFVARAVLLPDWLPKSCP